MHFSASQQIRTKCLRAFRRSQQTHGLIVGICVNNLAPKVAAPDDKLQFRRESCYGGLQSRVETVLIQPALDIGYFGFCPRISNGVAQRQTV